MNPSSGSASPKRATSSRRDFDNIREQQFPAQTLTSEQQELLLEIFKKSDTAPASVKKRGSSGGKAANQGKDHFKERIILRLEALPKQREKYPNISALFEAAFPAIEAEVAAFHVFLNSSQNKGPNRVTYGHTNRASGLLTKLRDWVNKDPQFRDRLAKLCDLGPMPLPPP